MKKTSSHPPISTRPSGNACRANRWLRAPIWPNLSDPAVLPVGRVVLPMAGLFDVDAERARLQKQIEEATAEVGRLEAKLGDANFSSRAPAPVVACATPGRLPSSRPPRAVVFGCAGPELTPDERTMLEESAENYVGYVRTYREPHA